MQSRATSVPDYLAELLEDRRTAISVVRQVILSNLPEGYEETMMYGMIGYRVPESVFTLPGGKPLGYIALASQKGYMALYLGQGCLTGDREEWFREEYRATGKRLDMGKGCIRFRKLDDLPLELTAKLVARTPMPRLIQLAQESEMGRSTERS